jgi:hypothetical protein
MKRPPMRDLRTEGLPFGYSRSGYHTSTAAYTPTIPPGECGGKLIISSEQADESRRKKIQPASQESGQRRRPESW